jgi:hypothetical protein
MAETKYGKYLKSGDEVTSNFADRHPPMTADTFHVRGREWAEIDKRPLEVILGVFCIERPFLFVDENHKHDYDQFLCFLGGDPTHVKEFDAEVEICLGKEQEKHTITKPTVVHIPKGMYHCPLTVKRVGKPFVFMDLMLTSDYLRTTQ